MKIKSCILLICHLYTFNLVAQDFSLLNQLNGRYDFTMIGNTLNLIENESNSACDILTSSSATLNLQNNEVVEAAYLYWSGSSRLGDYEVSLNGQTIQSERSFVDGFFFLPTFSAFANVTSLVQNTGNGIYTLSDLDLSNGLEDFCQYGVNYGGWAIVIVYENSTLPNTQINIYDGLQSVRSVDAPLSIQIDGLNVVDNINSRIGFLAWEGDSSLAVNETLSVNGNLVGNPPLNPLTNAFNGTNSFTNEANLYNMDLDVYDVDDFVSIGDTEATIELTSGQDYIMVNVIVSKLNSELPDAIITNVESDLLQCNERIVEITFDLENIYDTGVLPVNLPISIYIENELFLVVYSTQELDFNEVESFTENVIVPQNFPLNIGINIVADDVGNGVGEVIEFDETNNLETISVQLLIPPEVNESVNLLACNIGLGQAKFDLTLNEEVIYNSNNVSFSYFTSQVDAELNENEIINTATYYNNSNPQQIFVRVDNDFDSCYGVTSFMVETENCFPIVPEGFSPNNDLVNDLFVPIGLYDIFQDFELTIYNRFGSEIYNCNNNDSPWDGRYNGKDVTVGTYYYLLKLNDERYNRIVGWFYLNR